VNVEGSEVPASREGARLEAEPESSAAASSAAAEATATDGAARLPDCDESASVDAESAEPVSSSALRPAPTEEAVEAGKAEGTGAEGPPDDTSDEAAALPEEVADAEAGTVVSAEGNTLASSASSTRPVTPEARGAETRPEQGGAAEPRARAEARPPAQESRRRPLPAVDAALLRGVQGLGGRLGQVEGNLKKVARAMVEVAREGEGRQRAYDVLYGELRQYKEDFLWRSQRPIFMDLIMLFDSISRSEKRTEAVDSKGFSDELRYLREQLLELLYRYDIELIEEHPEHLDIGFQRPIKRVDCKDPADDRRVVECVREGFRRSGAVLRPQEIVVKRFVETQGEAEA